MPATLVAAPLEGNQALTPKQLDADKAFTRVANYGNLEVWRQPLPDGSLLVALGNRDKFAAREVGAYWTDLGLPPNGQALVTDLDGKKTLGRFATVYSVPVKADSVVTVRIAPVKSNPAVPDRQPTAKSMASVSDKLLNPRRLELAVAAPGGTFVERGYSGTPDRAGVLERYVVGLPAFTAGCYFSDYFPVSGNTMGPRVFTNSLAGLPYGGLFLLLKLKDGGFLAVVPVSGALAMTWLEPSAGGLQLDLGTRGTALVRGDLPLLAWSRAADPYAACASAWATAIQMKEIRGNTALRREKVLPEYFHYLGWCSWEQFHKNINEGVLSQAIRDIKASELPVRWMLIDDGHVANTDDQLTSFKPNENFPRGFAPVLELGRQNGIRWFGLWQYMSGYGALIDPQNELGLDQHLREVFVARDGRGLRGLLPKGDRASAKAFYSGLIGPEKAAGFDFIKMDFQSSHLDNYTGTENPVATTQLHYQVLEQECHDLGLGLLNCLSMNHLRVFNTRHSAVMRCSRDYFKDADTWNKEQTWRAFHNSLWLGQTMWLDQDMMHSSDQVAGRLLSISKALSGGPVYLSDDPKSFFAPNIRPLAFDTGELLRPLAPAAPLPASLFADPLHEAVAYQVVAPLSGQVAAVGIYNLTEQETRVEGRITADDYRAASAMLQPCPGPWPLPAEGLLVYDWTTGQASRLAGQYRTSVPSYSVRLLHLCPIRNGWAVIGRTDKYLSPAAVEVLECDASKLTLRLKENGPLAVWSATGTVKSGDAPFTSAGGGLWRAAYAAGREGVIRLRRF